MLTTDALKQMVEQNHDQSEEGHARLRSDYRSLEGRVVATEVQLVSATLHFQRIDETLIKPIEVSELRFTPAMVFTIVAVCASIIGGVWGSTYGLRSDMRDIATTIQGQTRMQDERSSAVKAAIESVQRAQQAQQLDMQVLRETVIKGQKR